MVRLESEECVVRDGGECIVKVGVCGESWEGVVWWEWMVREWRLCGERVESLR